MKHKPSQKRRGRWWWSRAKNKTMWRQRLHHPRKVPQTLPDLIWRGPIVRYLWHQRQLNRKALLQSQAFTKVTHKKPCVMKTTTKVVTLNGVSMSLRVPGIHGTGHQRGGDLLSFKTAIGMKVASTTGTTTCSGGLTTPMIDIHSIPRHQSQRRWIPPRKRMPIPMLCGGRAF